MTRVRGTFALPTELRSRKTPTGLEPATKCSSAGIHRGGRKKNWRQGFGETYAMCSTAELRSPGTSTGVEPATAGVECSASGIRQDFFRSDQRRWRQRVGETLCVLPLDHGVRRRRRDSNPQFIHLKVVPPGIRHARLITFVIEIRRPTSELPGRLQGKCSHGGHSAHVAGREHGAPARVHF